MWDGSDAVLGRFSTISQPLSASCQRLGRVIFAGCIVHL
jgi:hypothetical protein